MLPCENYTFSGHAIQRMFERNLLPIDIIRSLFQCEPIIEYPDDTPLPSVLVLAYDDNIPYHIVVGVNSITHDCVIITIYIPNPDIWEENYRTRRPK